MTISCLAVTSNSDLPETHLFIGLYKAGVDIEVLCPSSAPHRHLLVESGVPVHDLTLKKRFDKLGIIAIQQHLQRKRFSILHAFNNNAVSNSLIASKGFEVHFIAYRGIEGNVSYLDPFSLTTYLHPRVERIVCVANAIRDYFHNMSLLGIKLPVKKALTIYKGHDRGWYQEEPVRLGLFGVPDGVFTVGCIVNDRPRKGLGYLISATDFLPKDLPIHFIFIGNINSKKLLDQINVSSFRDRIHLLGFQKNAASIIKSCDVCILPAIKREGLPKGVIEGMIQGVAPIVTDSGGSPELVENGKSGLVIPAKSSKAIACAIRKLYSDVDLLNKIKLEASSRIVRDFHIVKTISQHLELYDDVVSCR